MKIVPIEDEKKISNILAMTYKQGSVQSIVQEFIDSGAQFAEITEIDHYSDAYSATASLNTAIKSMHVGAKAVTRKGHTYLMKTM